MNIEFPIRPHHLTLVLNKLCDAPDYDINWQIDLPANMRFTGGLACKFGAECGSFAHICIEQRVEPEWMTGSVVTPDAHEGGRPFLVTEAHTAAVADYVKWHLQAIRDKGGELCSEYTLRATPEEEGIVGDGRCDAAIHAGSWLVVSELKTGRSLQSASSPQLLCYAYRRLQYLEERGIGVDEIRTQVFQYGAGASETYTPAELRLAYGNILKCLTDAKAADSIAL